MKRLTTDQDIFPDPLWQKTITHQQKLHSQVSFSTISTMSTAISSRHTGVRPQEYDLSLPNTGGRRTNCGASAGSGRTCCAGPGTSPAVRTPLFRSMAATPWVQSQKHQFSLHHWYTISRCSTGTTRGSPSSQRWPSLTPSRSMPGGGRAFSKKRLRPYCCIHWLDLICVHFVYSPYTAVFRYCVYNIHQSTSIHFQVTSYLLSVEVVPAVVLSILPASEGTSRPQPANY